MNCDSCYEETTIKACLPLIEKIIRSLHFLPRDDLRSIALLSALCAIRSEDAEEKALEARIQERIHADLLEEKRALRKQGWSYFNVFSLDRFVSSEGNETFLDWIRSPYQTEQIVLGLEFQRSLSAEEREAAECLAFNCPLLDIGICGEHEVYIRRRIRDKWISVYGIME